MGRKRKRAQAIDCANLRILTALQEDGKTSYQELSEMVNLSPSPCHFRVKSLEQLGVIRGYRAEIDLVRFGPHVQVLTEISLEKHTQDREHQFRRYINNVDEVVFAYEVGGRFDYLLHFVCRDIDRYMRLTEEMTKADIGITRLTSHIVLGTAKSFQGFPLGALSKSD